MTNTKATSSSSSTKPGVCTMNTSVGYVVVDVVVVVATAAVVVVVFVVVVDVVVVVVVLFCSCVDCASCVD